MLLPCEIIHKTFSFWNIWQTMKLLPFLKNLIELLKIYVLHIIIFYEIRSLAIHEIYSVPCTILWFVSTNITWQNTSCNFCCAWNITRRKIIFFLSRWASWCHRCCVSFNNEFCYFVFYFSQKWNISRNFTKYL